MNIKGIKKLFLLDIGNTHTRYGLMEDGRIKYSDNCETRFLQKSLIPTIPDDVQIAAATVVPEAKDWFEQRSVFQVSHLVKTGVDLSLVDAATLGADRIANLAAMAHFSELPAIIIDCGTAVTLEALDSNRVFRGGHIAPGRFLSRKSLADYTAQLPFLPVDGTKAETFGWNTQDAIKLGTDCTVIGAVKEFVNTAKKELGAKNCKILVTGGDADILRGKIKGLDFVSVDFTLLGVAAIWKKNN